jgi:hypothetical protein
VVIKWLSIRTLLIFLCNPSSKKKTATKFTWFLHNLGDQKKCEGPKRNIIKKFEGSKKNVYTF